MAATGGMPDIGRDCARDGLAMESGRRGQGSAGGVEDRNGDDGFAKAMPYYRRTPGFGATGEGTM